MEIHNEAGTTNTSLDHTESRARRGIRRRSSNNNSVDLPKKSTNKKITESLLPKIDILKMDVSIGVSIKTNVVTSTTFREVLLQHVDGSMAAIIEKIRREPDKKKRNRLKQNLPVYSLSTYTEDPDGALIRQNEYFERAKCMKFDFDGIGGDESILEQAFKDLLKIDEVCWVVRSPYNLRAMVELSSVIKDPKTFSAVYKKISAEIEKTTGLDIDPSGSNANHVWYLSHDPDMVIREAPPWDISQYLEDENKKSEKVAKRKVQVQSKQKKNAPVKVPSTLLNALLELKFVHLGYHDWYNVLGLALAACFAGEGCEPFIEISLNEFYDDTEEYLRDVYDKLLDIAAPEKSSPKILYKLLKDHDIEIEAVEKTDGSFWVESEKTDGTKRLYCFQYLFNSSTLPLLGFFYIESSETVGRKLDGNLVKVGITRSEMKATVEAFVKSFQDDHEQAILEFLHKNSKLFLPANLEYLPILDLKWLVDDNEFIYFPHTRAITRKARQGGHIDEIGYDEIGDRHVNVDNVLDWDGVLSSREEANSCDYAKFLSRLCNGDPSRIDHMYRAFAYLRDGYKQRSEAVAVLLVDEQMGDNFSPMGGGGKGLALQGVMFMTNPCTMLDGKLFKATSQFQYQNVKYGDRFVIIDDVSTFIKSGDFFHQITGDFKIERKGKDALIIPFAESPRIAFTSNTLFVGPGSSNARRFVVLEISNHFNLNHTPKMEYLREMFSDEWDKEEYRKTISFWILTIFQAYLENGLSLNFNTSSLARKRIVADTSEDFVQWCEGYVTTDVDRVLVNDLRRQCMQCCGSKTVRHLEQTRNFFSIWLKKYVHEYLGMELQRDKSSGQTFVSVVDPSIDTVVASPRKSRKPRKVINEVLASDNPLSEPDDE